MNVYSNMHTYVMYACMCVCCVTEVTDYDERAYVAASLRARERERESSWSCVCVGVVKESARLRLSAGCQVAQVATQNIFVCMYVCMHVHRFIQTYEHENRTKYSKYISVWK